MFTIKIRSKSFLIIGVSFLSLFFFSNTVFAKSSAMFSSPREKDYVGDGINFNEGTTETEFTFKIIYKNKNNEPPQDVKFFVSDTNNNSTSNDPAWFTSNPDFKNGDSILSLIVYENKIYAGIGGAGDIYVFDGSKWSISYDGSGTEINAMTIYNDKLYAAQGGFSGDGDILVFDGSKWSISYNGNNGKMRSLAVYDNKLYAGQGGKKGAGDVYVFDGSTWSLSFNGASLDINALAVYDDKLYAAQGNIFEKGTGDIYVFDGSDWSLFFDGVTTDINALAVYDDKLYAGQKGKIGDSDIYVFDGSTWSLAYDGDEIGINTFEVYNDKLYAGLGDEKGIVLVFDGLIWQASYKGVSDSSVDSFVIYNNKLYAGYGGDDFKINKNFLVLDDSFSVFSSEKMLVKKMILDFSADPKLYDGNYKNGEQYIVTSKFPIQGKYQYHFEMSDDKNVITRWPKVRELSFRATESLSNQINKEDLKNKNLNSTNLLVNMEETKTEAPLKLEKVNVKDVKEDVKLENPQQVDNLKEAVFLKEDKGDAVKIDLGNNKKNTAPFVDIQQHWGANYINELWQLGVVQGKVDKTYDPDMQITRAELIKIALSAFNISVKEVKVKPFKDVDIKEWYASYIVAAKEKGIIDGYSDENYKPNEFVSRVEALKIILLALGQKITGGDMNFKDTEKGSWYEKYIAFAQKNKIIKGYDDGNFRPYNSITRAEIAKITVEILKLKK